MFSKEDANMALIEASKRCDIEAMYQALSSGANPNCRIETKSGEVNLIDFCKNFKGKKAKKALDLLNRFGGVPEKRNAQKKPHVVYHRKKETEKMAYKIRAKQR